MFQHSLLLAYRSFLRFKSTFFINLIGLSTGLAGALLIYLWVSDELSMDKFHEKDSRLFQVMKNASYSGNTITTYEATPGRLPKALAEEMPEVEQAVAVNSWSNTQSIVTVGNKHIKAKDLYAEKDFFAIFSYPLLQGDKNQVLHRKSGIALSDELAGLLFGTTENIIGKSIQWNKEVFWVSGVFQKPPVNSTAQFDVVLPFDVLREKSPELDEWFNGGCTTYLLLKEGTNIKQFNEKIRDFLQQKSADSKIGDLFIRPYAAKYLYDQYENGVQTGGRITYVRLFSIIAFFILLIACINFMNLSTAKVARRLKEVGVKKALGASRKTLIYQYLGESMLMALLALVLAIVLVVILLPPFNQITGKQLALHNDVRLILSCLGIAVGTGLIAGSYPALYLSGFQPVTVLKGKLPNRGGEVWVRQGLVVFQFTLSVIFIVAVLVVYAQIQLIQTKNLGYNRHNILMFKKEGKLQESFATFLREVKNIPGVINASSTWGNMTSADQTTDALDWQGKSPGDRITFANLQVNYDFIQTLGIELKEGRAFSRTYGADSAKIIFTEAAIAVMDLRDPVGKTVKLDGQERQIIGVVKNIHLASLHEQMKPAFLLLRPEADNIMLKIKAGTERETIAQVAKLYEAFNPGLPFEYKFLDDDFQALYAAEQRVAVLSRYFAGLAILISCLGLFGLATFTAERRRKEIGVRKVLGASRISIVYLLSSDFTKLVGVAIGVALPLSYLVVKNWLNDFEYRIDLHWWYFAGAGLAALVIAWLTVSAQAVKAASVNPVQSLKDE